MVFRVQRCAMLQFPDFHEKLLDALCRRPEGSPATEHAQSLILDILCWLAGVFSNGPCRYNSNLRHYLPKSSSSYMTFTLTFYYVECCRLCPVCSLKEGKESLLVKTRTRLTDIVRVCFFEAGRSIAHKCARFLALCIR